MGFFLCLDSDVVCIPNAKGVSFFYQGAVYAYAAFHHKNKQALINWAKLVGNYMACVKITQTKFGVLVYPAMLLPFLTGDDCF